VAFNLKENGVDLDREEQDYVMISEKKETEDELASSEWLWKKGLEYIEILGFKPGSKLKMPFYMYD
jgi:hypothetical protein